MPYMPFEYHLSHLRRFLMKGYTVHIEHYDSVLHPNWVVNEGTKTVTFGINLGHKRIRTILEDLISNRDRHVYRGRIESLFDGTATEDDTTALGITAERLGTDEYIQFLKKYRDRTLTNQYVKRLVIPFSD